MFLTRLGRNSKAVITGDVTQIDLPGKNGSGLVNANMVLKNVSGIRLVKFTEKDVVRHELVKKIIQAYNIADEEKDKLV
jgi:phosphate starvation-inducible PhoH-like protein